MQVCHHQRWSVGSPIECVPRRSPPVLRLLFSTERYQGKQAELTQELQQAFQCEKCFSTWGLATLLPLPQIPGGTTCKKDTAKSSLVWESVFGLVGRIIFSEKIPRDTGADKRDSAIVSNMFWKASLSLCAQDLPFPLRDTGAVTPLPHQELPGSLAWGNFFYFLKQQGPVGAQWHLDKQSRPNNVTKALKLICHE